MIRRVHDPSEGTSIAGLFQALDGGRKLSRKRDYQTEHQVSDTILSGRQKMDRVRWSAEEIHAQHCGMELSCFLTVGLESSGKAYGDIAQRRWITKNNCQRFTLELFTMPQHSVDQSWPVRQSWTILTMNRKFVGNLKSLRINGSPSSQHLGPSGSVHRNRSTWILSRMTIVRGCNNVCS